MPETSGSRFPATEGKEGLAGGVPLPAGGPPLPARSRKAQFKQSWREKKVLGVDYGSRNTGVAVSVGGMAPRPLDVLSGMYRPVLVEAVMDLAARERAEAIVVGLPVQPDQNGVRDRKKDSDVARRCRSFATDLARAAAPVGVPVRLADEAHTSTQAALDLATGVHGGRRSRALGGGDLLDAAAAARLLERFFDAPGDSMPWGPQPGEDEEVRWPELEAPVEDPRAQARRERMLAMMEMRHGGSGGAGGGHNRGGHGGGGS